jgi:hypothetical protein
MNTIAMIATVIQSRATRAIDTIRTTLRAALWLAGCPASRA